MTASHKHRPIRLTPPDAAITLYGCATCNPEYLWRAEQKLCRLCGRPGCPRDHVPLRSQDRIDGALTALMILVGAVALGAVVMFAVTGLVPGWVALLLGWFAASIVCAFGVGRWLRHGRR